MRDYTFNKGECTPKNFALYLDARQIEVTDEIYEECEILVRKILISDALQEHGDYVRVISNAVKYTLNIIKDLTEKYIQRKSTFQEHHEQMIMVLDDNHKTVLRESLCYETEDYDYIVDVKSTGYGNKKSYYIEPMEIVLYTAFRRGTQWQNYNYSKYDYWFIRDIIFNVTGWYRENKYE